MRLPSRAPESAGQASPTPPPEAAHLAAAVHGTVRRERRAAGLSSRLRRGEVAVIDQPDLDRATARDLLEAGVVAVVNAAPMLSGRYPALGPKLLADAGIPLLEGVGAAGFEALPDGTRITLVDGRVRVEELVIAVGRRVGPTEVDSAMASARDGLGAQLESLAHHGTELLRREEGALLHREGVPRVVRRGPDSTAVVLVPGERLAHELRALRHFLREQRPLVVAVGAAADTALAAKVRVDTVVVAAEAELPSAAALRAARDVVVCGPAGSGGQVQDGLHRLGLRPHTFASSLSVDDAALLVADATQPSLVVGVGLTMGLEEVLDRHRGGAAGTYLTRLGVGPRLIDAEAVRRLYTGRLRPWHLALTVLAGLAALAVAVATTPVGQESSADLVVWLEDLLRSGGAS